MGAADTAGASRIPVLVATTRQRATTDASDLFSGEHADQVSFASVTVSIPPDTARKIGEVQWPASLPADPQKDFAIVTANYLDRRSFAAPLTAEAKQTRRNKVLVFVHGFNNRVDKAVSQAPGTAHSRAFEDVTSVMGMIAAQLAAGQSMTEDRPALVDAGQ